VETLARDWGILTEYTDARGQPRTVAPETLRRLLEIVALGQRPPDPHWLPRSLVVRPGRPAVLPSAPGNGGVAWEISAGAQRVASGIVTAEDRRLPDRLPFGDFRLVARLQSGTGMHQESAVLLSAPEGAYSGARHAGRVWLLAVQLYAIRSPRNWGHGDFTDLRRLLEAAARLGAAGVGLNPLHALFMDDPELASPYSPNSRLFLNPLYIDLDQVPEFPGLPDAAQEIERLRRTRFVEYREVAAVKRAGLEAAFEVFRRSATVERISDFQAFRREAGDALARFASFETLARRFGPQWREWPERWRNAESGALREFRASTAEEHEFWEFVQWIADRQLSACRERARELGLPIGLYIDIAVGVHPNGADSWTDQSVMLEGATLGAPPDPLNTSGQDWGLSTFNPVALEQQCFAPFRRMLAASMRFGGAVRLDHVLGLNRLFLIPRGTEARDGAYIRFPLDSMLAVVAQESTSHECIVIGEDLGTVPDELRRALVDWGVWSYRVMLFERDHGGAFKPPDQYPENALVTFGTHDLPTFAGWAFGYDLRKKRSLGLDPGETDHERKTGQGALFRALTPWRGAAPGRRPPYLAVVSYLAATPTRLLAISLEDALGLLNEPNLPGTFREHPNWRRRVPVSLEDLGSRLQPLAEVLDRAGRSRQVK
jgi:4-alpha-glucanotransferase